jgi:hypothetical protein
MRAVIAALAIAALAMSCASEGDGPAERPPPPAVLSPAEAAPLSNLERSLLTCTSDTSCPRGSHCALGACAYECATDADCVHGRSCDVKGRCR